MPIEWDEKVETTRRVRLMVSAIDGVPVSATLDDLRKACEAVGYTSGKLAVELAAHMQGIIRNEGESIDDCVRRLTAERDAAIARAEKAEARVDELETPFRELGIGRHAGESISAFIKRVCVADRAYHHNVRRRASQGFALSGEQAKELVAHFESCLEELRNERDGAVARTDAWKEQCQKSETAESVASSAIGELNELLAAETARAEKAEAERDAFGAKNVEFHRAYGEEQARSREIIASLESRLAAVDLANGHANEAEARVMDADADSESYVTDLHAAKDRIAELETALANAANGIGVNDAGPVVYAANARHDEAAREWEDERAELVRTRQETQDKLSEARRELHELRGALSTAVRIGKPLSFSGPDSSPRFSITEDEAASRVADSRDAALIRTKTDAGLRPIEAAIESARLRAEELLGTRDLPETDEELWKLFDDTYDRTFRVAERQGSRFPSAEAWKGACEALAARVRHEQCLVTRAVESGRGFEVWGRGNGWNVMVGGKPPRVDIKTSDVARVLAEMLGEVGR